MDGRTRLVRTPKTTGLWILLTAVMTAFLTVAVSLWLSAAQLAKTVDEHHTAVAVRTDRAVTGTYIDGGYSYSMSSRTFSQEEIDWLTGLDSVKAVRIHTLSGAYSPDFEPVLGIRKERSWSGDGNTWSNSTVLVTGRMESIVDEWGGGHTGVFAVEQVVCAHPELTESMFTVSPSGTFYLRLPNLNAGGEPVSFLQEGRRYALCGKYVAWRDVIATREGEVWAPALYLETGVTEQRGKLLVHGIRERYADEAGTWREGELQYLCPVAQELDGDADEFFAREGIWKDYLAALERYLHSLPVLGTENVESMYLFVTNGARIIEGRSFTEEEYDSGARVLLLSEPEAHKHGLQVGDRVELRQFLCTGTGAEGDAYQNPSTDLLNVHGKLFRPVVGELDMDTKMGESETFTLVGIYRMDENWSYGSYAFTCDTAIVPQRAQIAGAWGRDSEDLYGVYLTVELVNGKVDDFRLAVSSSPYAGEFYTADQGFEQVQKSLNGLSFSAQRLLWIALAAWGIFLLLVLMLYQSGQRNNLGIMRSLGASPRQAEGYLWGSGMAVAAAGVILGAAVSGLALRAMQQTVLSDALAQIDRTAFSGGAAISDEALAGMVNASSLSPGQLALLALAQLCVIGLLLWVHARRLSRMAPRRLMGV